MTKLHDFGLYCSACQLPQSVQRRTPEAILRGDTRRRAKDTVGLSLALFFLKSTMAIASQSRKKFLLFSAYTVLGWRVVRRVSLERGEAAVGSGGWRRVYAADGQLIGFQMLTPEMARGDIEIPSIASRTAISVSDMKVNAGLTGTSRTCGLPEDRRLERKEPEDRIERTQAKIRVYPAVGPARGDILRVWPQR